MAEKRIARHWTPSSEYYPGSGDFIVSVFGWWVRFVWGITFKPKRLRWSRFYGHRLLAVRLWPVRSHDARLVGVQWRRSDGR